MNCIIIVVVVIIIIIIITNYTKCDNILLFFCFLLLFFQSQLRSYFSLKMCEVSLNWKFVACTKTQLLVY